MIKKHINLSGIVLASLLAVVASQLFATTPPIQNANGQPIPNSIATLERVELNGSQQWISIRGRDHRPIMAKEWP